MITWFIFKKKIVVDIPSYTKKKFLDEVNLFFDWYLPFFKIEQFDSKEQFNLIFSDYLRKLDDLPKVFVHRDYHIDNLFFLGIGKRIINVDGLTIKMQYMDQIYMILFHFVRMQELMFQQKLKIIWLNIFLSKKIFQTKIIIYFVMISWEFRDI